MLRIDAAREHKTSIQIKRGLQNRSLLEDTYMRISWLKYLFCSALLFLRSFFSSLLFWKAPERVQIMKKVNRNNGAIDVTTAEVFQLRCLPS